MKIYPNQCQHIGRTGERCKRTTKEEHCSLHKKSKPKQKCAREGCEVITYSKYGLCSNHSQKQSWNTWFTNKIRAEAANL